MRARPMPKTKTLAERYAEARKANPDAILIFRVGDFYELVHDDARHAAKTLGLALTSQRSEGIDDRAMTGFPYYQLDTYVRKLEQGAKPVIVHEA